MAIVAGIRFKDAGKVYYFDPGDLVLQKGDYAIVETARGMECGLVSMGNREVPDEEIVPPLKQIIRKATEEDLEHVKDNERRQKTAFAICEQKIADHKLDMKLVDVEYTFDNNKILFYFTSDGRVDFRNLVKDLAAVFRTRIELRQIGVRDEAKMLGGLGICGRPFCCSQFLGDFQPVSIKMAKEQGLSLNPVKISGTCGRLMCCLKYEQNAYEELIRITPRVGAVVQTPEGRGVVIDQNLIAGTVVVRPEQNPDGAPKTWKLSQLGENAAAGEESRPVRSERRSERRDNTRSERPERIERTEHAERPRPAVPEITDVETGAVVTPEVIDVTEEWSDSERTERPARPRNDRNKRNDRPRPPRNDSPKESGEKPDRPRNDRPKNFNNNRKNAPRRNDRPRPPRENRENPEE
jgi:cell fate regulator YaaT (PSP1 superfamily)